MNTSTTQFNVDFNFQMEQVRRQLDEVKGLFKTSGKELGSVVVSSLRESVKGVFQGIGQEVFKSAKGAFNVPGNMLGGWLTDAMDAKAISRKFATVFGDVSKEAEKFVKEFAAKTGGSEQQIKASMARFQDTFVPMGFSRAKGMDMTKTMTMLSKDLSISEGLSQEETSRDIMSAMVGNHEAVRKYGVMISEASMKAKLLQMGIVGGTEAATEQQKVLARLNMIIAGTRDAQGGAAAAANDLRSTLGGMHAIFTEISAKMGDVFMPAATQVAQFFKDIGADISAALGPSKDWGEALGNATARVLELMEPVRDTIKGMAERFADFTAGLTSGLDASTGSWTTFSETIAKVLNDANTRFQEVWSTVKEQMMEVFAGLSGVMLGLFGQTKTEIITTIQDIANAINTVIEGIESAIAKLNVLNVAKNAKYAAERAGIREATINANWNASPEQQALNNQTEREMMRELDRKYGFDSATTHATSKAFSDRIANLGKSGSGNSFVDAVMNMSGNYNAGVEGFRSSKLGQDMASSRIAAEAKAYALRIGGKGGFTGASDTGDGQPTSDKESKPSEFSLGWMDRLQGLFSIGREAVFAAGIGMKKLEIKNLREDKGIGFTSSDSLHNEIQKALGGNDKAIEIAEKQLKLMEEEAKRKAGEKPLGDQLIQTFRAVIGFGP